MDDRRQRTKMGVSTRRWRVTHEGVSDRRPMKVNKRVSDGTKTQLMVEKTFNKRAARLLRLLRCGCSARPQGSVVVSNLADTISQCI